LRRPGRLYRHCQKYVPIPFGIEIGIGIEPEKTDTDSGFGPDFDLVVHSEAVTGCLTRNEIMTTALNDPVGLSCKGRD
jgi:hypothetical protein